MGVLTGFGLIAIIVVIGYLLGRSNALGEGAGTVLSKLAFFVASPALLFVTLQQADLADVFSLRSAIGWASAAAMCVVYALLARLVLRRGAAESVIGSLAAGYINAGNLGIPIAVFALGGAAAVAPAMIFQLVVLAPIAFVLLDTLTAVGGRSRIRAIVTPLLNPVLLGSAAGVAAAALHWQPPAVVLAPIEILAGLAVPSMLLAFGISLRGSPMPGRSDVRAPMLLAVGLKTVVHPALAWGVGAAVGLQGADLLALVVIAALPTAQNVFTYAMRYGTGIALARESVLVTTFAAVPVVVLAAAVLG